MDFSTNLLARLLFVIVVSSAAEMKSKNNSKKRGEGPSVPVTNFLHSTEISSAVDSSTKLLLQTTTVTLKTRERHINISTGTAPVSKVPMTTQPMTSLLMTSQSTPVPQHTAISLNAGAQNVGRHKEVALLVVLPVLSFTLLAVGAAVAVFCVHRKRLLRVKEGFQEEMACICLHDEVALEALSASWKPFMDTSDMKEIKLVLEVTS